VKRGVKIGVLAIAAVLAAAGSGRAADKDAVNAAVERGVKNLKSFQGPNGTWPHDHAVGMTALCGLTLLECGVPVDDDAIQKAADAIRAASVTLDHNYSVALSILFLDRLGEPVDVALIESLTVRLLAAQGTIGSWGYTCPAIGEGEQRRLTTLVKKRAEAGRVKDPPKAEPGQRGVKDLPQEIQAQLAQVARQQNRVSGGDNSNTQFAVLALWVARRHGLPVDAALTATEKYFRATLFPEGGWSYMPAPPSMPRMPAGALRPPGMTPTPAMTCAGLLGIGLAYGAWNDAALRTDTKKKEPGKPGPAPVKPQDPSKDKAVTDALRLLGAWVDAMAADHAKGKVPQITHSNGRFYYFLWSLERVSVAYGIDKIGKTDWYDWGTEILLANQGADGGWNNGEFPGGPDTCFALLFLKRANLAQDLSRALKSQMKEGMQSALRQGGLGGADLVKGRKPFFDGPAAEDPKHKPDADEEARAAKLGKQLAAAEGDKLEQALKELRDNKGAAYTQALATAIPQLEGDALKKAREALAERMSRMTSATLGVKLDDDDPEVRRAAALGVAMKEDKAYLFKLIEMLSDREATVGHAAHAALKSLTNEDFGPAKGAGREERAKAILAWKAWLAKQQGEK
jgi:hypothetical protein